MDRITAIRLSLIAFTCGIIGLIPGIGLPFGLYTMFTFFRIRQSYHDWNPAEFYLKFGMVLAALGFVLSITLRFVIGKAIMESLMN